MTATITDKYLRLTIIDNGGDKSLIDDAGRIWATGRNSREMLREAGWDAKRDGYTVIAIGDQTWDVAACIAD